jgi:hypothetical protein
LDWDFLVAAVILLPGLVAAAVLVELAAMHLDPLAPPPAAQEFLTRFLERQLLIVQEVVQAILVLMVVVLIMELPDYRVPSSFVIQHKKEKIICL